MTDHKFSLRNVIVAALLALTSASAYADALVKPVPQPDTKKLPADAAKKLADSRAEFEKARVDLVGDNLATAYAQLGGVYFRAGFTDAAAVALYDANQLAPQDPRWLYVSGVIARVQKKNADARTYFQNALAIDAGYVPSRLRLADTLSDLGDFDGARRILLEGLAQKKDDASLYAFVGRVELKQHRYADAVPHLQQALKLEPQATSLYKDLVDAYTGQGDAKSAADAKAKAGETPPSINDPLIASFSQGTGSNILTVDGTPLEQARQFVELRQFDAAHITLDAALKTTPNDFDTLVLAARVDALLGNRSAAQDEISRALKLKPEDAGAVLTQGLVYEFGGDEGNALKSYERAAQLDDKLPEPPLLIGNALMRQGKFMEAADRYRKVAAIDPRAVEPNIHVAAALTAAGRCRDALNFMNQSLAKNSKQGEWIEVFVRLASTCPNATAEERGMALDYASELYKSRPSVSDTAAFAMAQAANGKFDDAQRTQAEVVFEAQRSRDPARIKATLSMMERYKSKHAADKAWPDDHPYLKPPQLTALKPAKPAR